MDARKLGSTAYPIVWLMVSTIDHISPRTGLTPTIMISKNGSPFVASLGVISEIGNGWYKLAGNATDRNTLGELIVHAEAIMADPADVRITIVAFDPFDANLAMPRLDASVGSRAAPGDAMDLVTDAVDVNAVATSGANEIRDAILTDATAFAGADIAAIRAKTNNLPVDPASESGVLAKDATVAKEATLDGVADLVVAFGS